MLGTVQPDELGQHVGIGRVGLRPGHRVPLPGSAPPTSG
jgi:hypothetical protein